MTHFDICSGIGGFALAARWANIETVGFCEKEPFCREVLAHHWPGVWIHDDLTTLTGDLIREHGIGDIDLLTGGIPCQPASLAGKRKGAQDSRWLWPDFLRLVRELRPLWVLAENPRGICSLQPHGLDWIRDCLGAAGYQSEVYLLAASDIGASHKRERVWIVAHAGHGSRRAICPTDTRTNPTQERSSDYNAITGSGKKLAQGFPPGPHDYQSWATVASLDATLLPCIERSVYDLVDGVSVRMVRQHNKAILKALGNAIVPPVAYILMQSIKEQL